MPAPLHTLTLSTLLLAVALSRPAVGRPGPPAGSPRTSRDAARSACRSAAERKLHTTLLQRPAPSVNALTAKMPSSQSAAHLLAVVVAVALCGAAVAQTADKPCCIARERDGRASDRRVRSSSVGPECGIPPTVNWDAPRRPTGLLSRAVGLRFTDSALSAAGVEPTGQGGRGHARGRSDAGLGPGLAGLSATACKARHGRSYNSKPP